MTHTRWQSEFAPDGELYVFDLNDDGSEAFAIVRGIDTERAALLTVAPELLEALEECVAALTDPVIGTTKMDDPDWYGRVWSAAASGKAAIAKAKGGQS